MNKKLQGFLIAYIMIMATICFTGCGYGSNEPCVWCGNAPTKQIASETEDCEAQYYCKECSTTCMGCGNKATTHATNLLGAELFLCDDCAD